MSGAAASQYNVGNSSLALAASADATGTRQKLALYGIHAGCDIGPHSEMPPVSGWDRLQWLGYVMAGIFIAWWRRSWLVVPLVIYCLLYLRYWTMCAFSPTKTLRSVQLTRTEAEQVVESAIAPNRRRVSSLSSAAAVSVPEPMVMEPR